MINSIEIKNFLSHKKTKLDFSPGVNIIVGPTDSGKSAIVRALRWVITNRPTGDSFRSYWGGSTEVIIDVDNYHISRLKSDKENKYSIDEEIFKAFGADVPTEIKKILNLNNTNLQTQFESHFLLSKSAGEVASHFNKVAHLDKIDIGLQNIQRWLKILQQGIVHNKSQVVELFEQLKEYDSLDSIEELITQAEKVDTRLEENENNFNQLTKLKTSIYDINTHIGRIEKIASKGVLVDKVLFIVEQEKVAAERLNSLEKARKGISQTRQEINTLERILPMEKIVNRALEIEKEIEVIGFGTFTKLTSSIQIVDMENQSEEEHLKEIELKFHEEMKVCPLCDTVLNGTYEKN